jgi:DNA-binding NarL/FixJ family response regulator
MAIVAHSNPLPFHEELTSRERDVLHLLVQGLSNPEIAAALFISQSTVKTHLRSIFKKLDVEHRVQAVVIAMQRDLI